MNQTCGAERLKALNRFAGMTLQSLSEIERNSVIALALEALSDRHRPGTYLRDPCEACTLLQVRMAEYRTEIFGAIYLDNRRRVISIEELFRGTINAASVHPRVVVQLALERNAVAVVLFHNHPSGIAEPSRADEALTVRLKDALELVDVHVLDHIIVAAEGTCSLAQRGLL